MCAHRLQQASMGAGSAHFVSDGRKDGNEEFNLVYQGKTRDAWWIAELHGYT